MLIVMDSHSCYFCYRLAGTEHYVHDGHDVHDI